MSTRKKQAAQGYILGCLPFMLHLIDELKL